jgi:hypothetical protein
LLQCCHLQEHLQCSKPEAALPFILLFGSICRSQPALLCQHLPQLKECLAQLPALGSDDAALALLLALWPLCRLHADLQDHLLLLLRKALISREVACRCGSVLPLCVGSHAWQVYPTHTAGVMCASKNAATRICQMVCRNDRHAAGTVSTQLQPALLHLPGERHAPALTTPAGKHPS